MKGGSFALIMAMMVICVCVLSSSMMSVMGPVGSLFGGIGSLFSGEAFKPKLQKVGTIQKDDLKPATAECDEECQKKGAMLRKLFSKPPKRL